MLAISLGLTGLLWQHEQNLAEQSLRARFNDRLRDTASRIVQRMSAVDTSGVEPLYTPLSAVQAVALRLRDDVVTEADQRALNQTSAPRVEDGLFLVPKVIE
mgnify:CR=1 FL=1